VKSICAALGLTALVALSGCLWRPPPIPPLLDPTASDAGTSRGIDASSPAPPGTLGLAECSQAAARNDGSAPSSVLVDGSVISCGAIDSSMQGDGGRDADAMSSDGAGDSAPDAASPDPDASVSGADGA
jgi:hypothetical protein